jgi:hypothetical protein
MMNIKRTAEDAAAGENPDELYLAENVFWVPKEARAGRTFRPTPSSLADRRGDGPDRGGESRPERHPDQGL